MLAPVVRALRHHLEQVHIIVLTRVVGESNCMAAAATAATAENAQCDV